MWSFTDIVQLSFDSQTKRTIKEMWPCTDMVQLPFDSQTNKNYQGDVIVYWHCTAVFRQSDQQGLSRRCDRALPKSSISAPPPPCPTTLKPFNKDYEDVIVYWHCIAPFQQSDQQGLWRKCDRVLTLYSSRSLPVASPDWSRWRSFSM